MAGGERVRARTERAESVPVKFRDVQERAASLADPPLIGHHSTIATLPLEFCKPALDTRLVDTQIATSQLGTRVHGDRASVARLFEIAQHDSVWKFQQHTALDVSLGQSCIVRVDTPCANLRRYHLVHCRAYTGDVYSEEWWNEVTSRFA